MDEKVNNSYNDKTTNVTLTISNAAMHSLLRDMLDNSHSIDSTDEAYVYISKRENDWFYHLESHDVKESWPLNMEAFLSDAFLKILNESKEQIYDYLRNDLYSKIHIEMICQNPDLAIEHLSIITSFEKPQNGTVFKKVDDYYFLPVIVYLYKDNFGDKLIKTIPITHDQLFLWDMSKKTLFDHAFKLADKRLAIEDYSKLYDNNNPDINKGKVFYSAYDSETLCGNAYHIIYSTKFRNYIAENYKDGVFVSFPHPSMGFIWPKEKLSRLDSITQSSAVLSNKTYIFNNVIHFDSQLPKYDLEMKHRLYYIPADPNEPIIKCC